ncbi:MAG: hypothetical protein ABIH26_06030 [Candidatus Eisenbacteria bacterium]
MTDWQGGSLEGSVVEGRQEGVLSAVLRPVSPLLAGTGWALLLVAAVRESRPLFGPSLSTATVPAVLFVAGLLVGMLVAALRPRMARLRLDPAALALLLVVFPYHAVSAGGRGDFPAIFFAVLVFLAGALLGRGAAGPASAPGGAPDRSLSIGLLGACCGALLGSRVLVPWMGDRGAAIGAFFFLLLAGLAGSPRAAAGTSPGGGESDTRRDRTGLLLAGLFGLLLPLAVVGWGRTLDLLIGPTFRATGLLWTFLLLGLSLGSLAAERREGGGRSRAAAAVTAGLYALLLLAIVGISARLPYLFLRIAGADPEDPALLFRARALVTAIVVLPCACLAGFLGGALLRPDRREGPAGPDARLPWAVWAFSAAAAALLSPLLLPHIGIRGLLLASAALSAFAGILLLGASGSRLRVRLPLAAALLFLLVVTLASPPRWRPGLLNTAVFRYARLYEKIDEGDFEKTYSIVPSFYREGAQATVMVIGAPGSRFLASNGVVEVSDRTHLPVQVLTGRLPLLFRPAGGNVFLAGAGAGITAGTLLAGGAGGLLCADAEPSHIEAMRYFTRANREPWNDPRFRFRGADPRAALARGGERYDLIASQPAIPWDRNAAHRNTEEFFRLAAARLRPGGIFSASFPLAGVGEEHLRSFLGAFRAAFPWVLAVETDRPGALVLLGSDAPLRIRAADLLAFWRDVTTQTDLLEADIRSVHELVAVLRLDGETIDSYVKGSRRNRDANGFIELGAEALAARLEGGRLSGVLRALHFDADRVIDYNGLSPEERGAFQLDVARAFRRSGNGFGGFLYAGRAYETDPTAAAAGVWAHFLKKEAGDLDSAIAVLRTAWERDREDRVLIRQLSDYLFTARRFEECDRLLTEAIEGGLGEAWFHVVRGKARLGLKEHERALEDLLLGKELDRLQDNSGDINFFIGMAYKNLGRIEDSESYLSRAIARNPRHLYAKMEYGENKLLSNEIDRGTFESEYLIHFNRARAETLFDEASERLYEPQHAEEVERNLNAVVNTTPRHHGAYVVLAEFYHRADNPAKEREALERMIAEFGPRPEVTGAITEYLRSTGGEGRVRAYRDLLR